MSDPISLSDYFRRLEQADWYYDFSDDHRVWSRGSVQMAELRGLSDQSPQHKLMWSAWHDHMFGGPTWGRPEVPRPVLDNYKEPT